MCWVKHFHLDQPYFHFQKANTVSAAFDVTTKSKCGTALLFKQTNNKCAVVISYCLDQLTLALGSELCTGLFVAVQFS